MSLFNSLSLSHYDNRRTIRSASHVTHETDVVYVLVSTSLRHCNTVNVSSRYYPVDTIYSHALIE